MSTYTVDTDTIFLRCCDKVKGLIEVYEIESVDTPLIEKKHWSSKHDDETIRFGRRNEYAVLKMGDIEISGRDLDNATRDLYDSRCMVNREGLCILPIAEMIKSSEVELEVEYYRVFDLFNWSNYQNTQQSVTTRWSRNDVLTGRSILLPSRSSDPERERLEQKVKELEKKLSEAELEVEKKDYEITELVKRHEQESEIKKRQIIELEEELLKLPTEGMSLAIYKSMVERVRVPFTSIYLNKDTETNAKWKRHSEWYEFPITGNVINTQLSEETISDLESSYLHMECAGEFDTDNWWAVKISGFDAASKWRQNYELYDDPEPFYGTFIYYDGNRHSAPVAHHYRKLRVPIPVAVDCAFYTDWSMVCIHLQGIGIRYGTFKRDNGKFIYSQAHTHHFQYLGKIH